MDYAPVKSFLIGRCGKTVKEAALTSLEEYNLLVEGHSRAEQEEWERMRWRVFMEWTISPNLKRRPKKPQDVIRFPWEREDVPQIVTAEPMTEAEITGLCEIFELKRENISNGQDK